MTFVDSTQQDTKKSGKKNTLKMRLNNQTQPQTMYPLTHSRRAKECNQKYFSNSISCNF
jgi:hypothetical protein